MFGILCIVHRIGFIFLNKKDRVRKQAMDMGKKEMKLGKKEFLNNQLQIDIVGTNKGMNRLNDLMNEINSRQVVVDEIDNCKEPNWYLFYTTIIPNSMVLRSKPKKGPWNIYLRLKPEKLSNYNGPWNTYL